MWLTLAIILIILWLLGLIFHFLVGWAYVVLVIGVIFGIVHFAVRGGKNNNPPAA